MSRRKQAKPRALKRKFILKHTYFFLFKKYSSLYKIHKYINI